MKAAAISCFTVAAVAGFVLAATTAWWLVAVGVFCIIGAWFYTGGKKPYGYAGLGELFVFVFFGLVATFGTVAIQVKNFFTNADGVIWTSLGAVSMGLFASAVLMVNNIRDLDLDKHVGKRTLAVKLGKRWAKAVYFVMLWAPFAILAPLPMIFPATFFTWLALFFVIPATLIVATAKQPKELILALKLTSFAALAYGLFLGWGFATVVFVLG